MKLTEEQVKAAKSAWVDSKSCLPDWLAQYEFPDSPPEPNTTRWYHCSERLPTLDEADRFREVCSFHPDGGVGKVHVQETPEDLDLWWTPAPKNLAKPTPPDPFEEWLSAMPNRDEQTHHIAKEWLRKAYELGRSQPKQ